MSADDTKKGVELLSKEIKTDFSGAISKVGGDYEKLRKKLVTAKNYVLSFDLAFSAGSVGSIGYFNNYMTKKKTGREGFSAEFSMADENVTDKRAEKYKKNENMRKAAFVATV